MTEASRPPKQFTKDTFMSADIQQLDKKRLLELFDKYRTQLDSGAASVIARRIPVVRIVTDEIVDLVIVSKMFGEDWRDKTGDITPKELNPPFVHDPYSRWTRNADKSELTSGTIVISNDPTELDANPDIVGMLVDDGCDDCNEDSED